MKIKFIANLLVLISPFASLAEAGPLDSKVVSLDEGATRITLLKLPRATDIKPLCKTEQPDLGKHNAKHNKDNPKNKPDAAEVIAYEIPEIYIASTELSLSQLKLLVSQPAWQKYQDDLLGPKQDGKSRDEKKGQLGVGAEGNFAPMKKAIERGSSEYPAILVDLALLQQISKNLKQKLDQTELVNEDLLETLVRIPTRMEWQYMARAIESPKNLVVNEHFAEWVENDTDGELLQKLEVDYNHIRGTVGKPEAAGIPNQSELIQDLDKFFEMGGSESHPKQWGYQVLGKLLQQTHGAEYDLTNGTHIGWYDVQTEFPNAWGFHRFYGNASEWALHHEDINHADDFWSDDILGKTVQELKSSDKQFGVTMGGSSGDLRDGEECWKPFSIAHGQANNGGPYQCKHAFLKNNDGKTVTEFKDLKPGVRLLVRIRMHPSWFTKYRRMIFIKDIQNRPSGERITASQKKFAPIFDQYCTAKEKSENNLHLDLYERLAVKREEIIPLSEKNGWWIHLTDDQIKSDKRWWKDTTALTHQIAKSYVQINLVEQRLATLEPLEPLEPQMKPNKEEKKGGLAAFLKRKKKKQNKKTIAKVDYFSILADLDDAKLKPQ